MIKIRVLLQAVEAKSQMCYDKKFVINDNYNEVKLQCIVTVVSFHYFQPC